MCASAIRAKNPMRWKHHWCAPPRRDLPIYEIRVTSSPIVFPHQRRRRGTTHFPGIPNSLDRLSYAGGVAAPRTAQAGVLDFGISTAPHV
jgi:hypothetical protein